MWFFGKKKKGKVVAVLEIADSSIGEMMFYQDKDGRPEIISCRRTPVNFLLEVSYEAFWRCVRDAVKKTIEKMFNDYPAGPDAVLCVFSSPWFVSQTKIINIEREKPFKVDRDFFEKLLKAERKNHEGKRPIENEIIKTEINGHYAEFPLEKTAGAAKVYIYEGLVIEEVVAEMEKEILKKFGDVKPVFKTFPLLSFCVLNDFFNSREGFVLVDVRGEITDISIVRNNCLDETISFYRGRNSTLRKIAAEFRTFPREASSRLQTYLKGHSSKDDAEKIKKIISESKAERCDLFYRAREKASGSRYLPR